MIKCTRCSPRGPGLESQHPHGILELSVTPVSEHLMTLSGVMSPCTEIDGGRTPIHMK